MQGQPGQHQSIEMLSGFMSCSSHVPASLSFTPLDLIKDDSAQRLFAKPRDSAQRSISGACPRKHHSWLQSLQSSKYLIQIAEKTSQDIAIGSRVMRGLEEGGV